MGRAIRSVKLDSSVSNIPVAFDATAGSKLLTGLGTTTYTNAMVINTSATAVSIVFNGDKNVAPGATSTARAFLNATASVTFNDISIGDAIYIQSEGSAISSGLVEIMVW